MKKLFISIPMRGRTEENIKKGMEKMHKLAEIIFDQKLEVIPTWIEEEPPKNNNKRIWYLGKSIQLLSEADFFIGMAEYSDFYRGCSIERGIANDYGVRTVCVNVFEIMPDVVEIERDYYRNMEKTCETKMEV